ncbi:c-type cytochrome, partial [bacterium]|nr:c-type cytochrome [bacterium]
MRDFKILLTLIILTGFTYWGIEPYAESIMHPEVKPADYRFSDLYADAKTPKQVNAAEAALLETINSADPKAGKTAFLTNCTSCHSLHNKGINAEMDEKALIASYGFLPPDLSNAGSIYSIPFLYHLILDPADTVYNSVFRRQSKERLALESAHVSSQDRERLDDDYRKSVASFTAKKSAAYKMPMLGLPEQKIADIAAYFQSISDPIAEISGREITVAACSRCHSVNYDSIALKANADMLQKYLGTVPPDLSQMIKSRGENYLVTFINDPQKHLLGTAMPRVGLSKIAEEKVIAYLTKVGDPYQAQRRQIGFY